MSRLVIHIGMHKTGTTTIQRALAKSRERLAAQGVVYPRIGPRAGHHALVAQWVALPSAFRVSGGPDPVWRWLDATHARGDRTVILSSEKFCCGRAGARIDMAALCARAARFDRVEVVCALRDQASLVQAFYIETARHRSPGRFGDFVRTALDEGFAGNLWLDYGRLYEHLRTGFAPDEIRFVSFDVMRAHPGGVLGHFLATVIPEVAAETVAPLSEAALHVSPRPLEFLAAQALTAPRFPDGSAQDLVRKVLARRLGPGVGGTLFTGDELARIKARFEPLNARLAERLCATDPEFEMPAFPDWADLPGRETLDADFWTAMARAVNALPAPNAQDHPDTGAARPPAPPFLSQPG